MDGAALATPRTEISIHALLAESDMLRAGYGRHASQFLSTLSLRRATGLGLIAAGLYHISIHALLAESDSSLRSRLGGVEDFYPRSPCGERRALPLPTSGATYFYPRSPCGERRWRAALLTTATYFYPRSPCGERRRTAPAAAFLRYFYPRSPCGERPHPGGWAANSKTISIHALLAESDMTATPATQSAGYFYPRSPCGERLLPIVLCWYIFTISIHALLAESDPCYFLFRMCKSIFLSTLSLRRATLGSCSHRTSRGYFYPRSPCGERPCLCRMPPFAVEISIHALLAESDPFCRHLIVDLYISIHALLAESDRECSG